PACADIHLQAALLAHL
ncbi:hypothetical protein, partial [Aeromonas dhakensis]